jgi:hypothetical protein
MHDARFRSLFLALAVSALLPIGSAGQQPPLARDSVGSNLPQPDNLPQPEWVKIYSREQGITEPTLIQPAYSLQGECKGDKDGGSVKFAFVVDSNGLPRNVVFERALANGVDLVALKLMLDSKFQPAMLNGSPVAAGRKVEMRLQICTEQKKDPSGRVDTVFRLRLPPEEKFAEWPDPPVQANLAPISMPPGMRAEHEPTSGSHFTPSKALIRPKTPDVKGIPESFLVSLIVDEHGIPHDLKALQFTNRTLLPQILECIRNTRYQPALNDGMPVPALLTIGIDIQPLRSGVAVR